LIIDPVTHLPYQVLEHNNVDGKSYATRTIYTDINTRPTVPLAMSWYYSTYQTNYKLKEQPNVKPLIVAGTLLPDWSLPEYNGEHSGNVQNAMFKNKLVLMDFWIKNCGYCMEAFRHLKDLQQKYSEQLQILAVNAYDPQEDIVFFYNRENPQYKMLYQGKKLAKELGVGSYPKVVLADKEGKVIYAGDFNTFKIEALIRSYK
jgi:thiol-disulfide isomerase/thioredoxin